MAYLVTVAPEEVLGADVLVGVLGLLLTGVDVLLVLDVLPVGIPPQLGVDAGEDDAGDGDAVDASSVTVPRANGANCRVNANLHTRSCPRCDIIYTVADWQLDDTQRATYYRLNLRQNSPLSPPCSAMRARSRLNSLSSAPANCLGLSEL